MERRTKAGQDGRATGASCLHTRRRRVLAALIALVVWPAPAVPSLAADTFVLVVHPSNPLESISKADASAMFLKRVTDWPHGGRVMPVDGTAVSPLRESFSKAVHGKDSAAILRYWQQVIFSGRGVPPPVKANDAEIVAYVASHPGAIGYVSPGSAGSTVKALRVE